MTEQISPEHVSIGEIEREQAPQQARVRAVIALNRSGMPHADSDTVDILHDQFPQLRKMEGLVASYNRGVSDIVNGEETDQEARELAYEKLVGETEPAFEQAADEFQRAVHEQRRELQRRLFGHNSHTPYADAATVHSREMNYRDAIYTAANAKDSELEGHMEIAEMTNDKMLMKAVAAVADKRGNQDLVFRYLSNAGDSVWETYTRRSVLPKESSMNALINAYKPRRVARGSLAPNAHAMQLKREREARESDERRRLFRS